MRVPGALLGMPGRVATIAVVLIVAAPGVSRAQVFDQVIESIFNGQPANCQESFEMSPTGALATLCEAGGTNLVGNSGGSVSALSNESNPAPERLYEKEVGSLNVFFSADYEHFQKQTTRFEPAYKNYIWRGAVGADYAQDAVTVGGALRYIHDNGKFGGSGSPGFETNSYGLVLYGNYAPSERSFVSGSVGYMRQNFDIERAVFFDPDGTGDPTIPPGFLGVTRGKPNGNEFQAQVNGGYDFRFDSFTIGPTLGVNYLYDDIDNYSERGSTGMELKYSDLEEQSLTSRLGGHGSVAISTSFGVIVPQVTGEYVHEFMDPQRKTEFRFVEDAARVRFRFQNDKPDRDYFEVGASVVLQLADGIAPFVSFRTLLGYNQYASRQVTAGARFEF
jgi:uncharacterized protein YhjY with autotransporter beta-barrel domain